MSFPENPLDHWALAPFLASPLDDENFLIVRQDDGSSAVLDASWRSVLGDLGVFRTLAKHAEIIADRLPDLQGSNTDVEAVLAQLVEKGLFQGASQLAAEIRQGAAGLGAPSDPPRIIIITCERPAALKRLLDSLVANEERFGNRWFYEVIDDSRSAQAQQDNRALVREAAKRLDIHYLGPAEQQAFLDRLFQALPQARDARWLLEREAGESESTYGIPKNLALLRHAGRRLLLVDDDAVINAARLPGAPQAPRFDRHQKTELLLDLEEMRHKMEPYHEDPFAAHAAVLGHPVGEVIGFFGGEGGESAFFDVAIGNVATLRPQLSRVSYSLNGVLGDPGTDTNHRFFSPKKQAFTSFASDDERYRQLKQCSRLIFRGGAWPSLYNDGWLHQVTCVGVDVSRYIAPLYPTGRGEDTLLGDILQFLYPNAFGVVLPFTLEHLPADKRGWVFDPDVFAFEWSVMGQLIRAFSRLKIPWKGDPVPRIELFAEFLRRSLNVANPNATLRGTVKTSHLQYLANEFRLLSDALDSVDDPSPSWRQEVENLHEAIIDQLDDPPDMCAEDEKRLRRGLLRYADAVFHWNTVFEYCRANPC
ncbi:MAG: hypothetical protein ABFS45_05250 [Pseudomonadota bacterium]